MENLALQEREVFSLWKSFFPPSSPGSRGSRSLVLPQTHSLPNPPMRLLKRLEGKKSVSARLNHRNAGLSIYTWCLDTCTTFIWIMIYLVWWCRGAPRTQWLDCCFLAPTLYPADTKKKKKSVRTPKQSYVFWIVVKRNVSCLFAHGSSPPRLAHLAGADSAKHFWFSLHLHQLGSGCRTEGPWFDLELI